MHFSKCRGFKEGFDQGVVDGRRVGWQEGFEQGLLEGQKLGTRIGTLLVPLMAILNFTAASSAASTALGAASSASSTASDDDANINAAKAKAKDLVQALSRISLKNEEDPLNRREQLLSQLEAKTKALVANFSKLPVLTEDERRRLALMKKHKLVVNKSELF